MLIAVSRSKLRTTGFSRPAEPAIASASNSDVLPGSSAIAVTSETNTPANMISICWKSVHVTAWMPPMTV